MAAQIQVLEDAVDDLENDLATKQATIIRLSGTITNEKFTHEDLAGVQLGQVEAIVGGLDLTATDDFTKNTADNFITIPDAIDGTKIKVKIYPI